VQRERISPKPGYLLFEQLRKIVHLALRQNSAGTAKMPFNMLLEKIVLG
jgi:hypothetical protein